MKAFEYTRPDKLEQAVAMLGPGSRVLAGGTDLLSLMKDGADAAERLVDIKRIKNLKGISRRGGMLEIGALSTLRDLIADDNVRRRFPALVQAAEGVRSPQVLNRGTVGGDLCQRPRCWYFRNGFGLLAEQHGASMVPDGDNRYHAILGNDGPAYFVNASSLAPALIALGARLQITGRSGQRETPVAEFYQAPASGDEREYRLAPDEIVTSIRIPTGEWANATYEIRQKEALDWPLAAAAVALRMNGDSVEEARVVLGHVAPTPWPSSTAAATVAGGRLTAERAQRAGEAAVEGARALSQNAYKIRLAQVAVKRALLRAAGEEV